MNDDGPSGTLILADESMRNLTWHHSVEFDGYKHTTACGRDVGCDDIRDVVMNPVDGWHKNVTPNNGCPSCYDSVHGGRDASENTGKSDRRDA